MYFLNLSFLQFAAVFGSISAISVALYLLDRSRRKQVVSTLRFWVSADEPTGAAQAHSAALVAAAATAQHGAAGSGHGAVACGHSGAGWARSRHHSGHFFLDGGAFRKSHTHGYRPRASPPISARLARPRPRDAGEGRCPGHAGDCLRTGPAQGGIGYPSFATGLDGPQSGSGPGVCAAHAGTGWPPRRRDRFHRT